MESLKSICSFCTSTSEIFYHIEDSTRVPNGLVFEGQTDLQAVLQNILNIDGKTEKSTSKVCKKCFDVFHRIYFFAHKRNKSEKILRQLSEVAVLVKKLKQFPVDVDIKTESEDDIVQTDEAMYSISSRLTASEADWNDLQSKEKSSFAWNIVKKECENNFEAGDSKVAITDSDDGQKNVEPLDDEIFRTRGEDSEEIIFVVEIIEDEGETTLEDDISVANILDKNQATVSCDISSDELATVSCLGKHTKNLHKSKSRIDEEHKIENNVEFQKRSRSKKLPKCNKCNIYFLREVGLERHMQEAHARDQCRINAIRKTKAIDFNRLFKCDQCPARFRKKSSVTLHRRRGTCKKHMCLECDMLFSNKSNLTRHIRDRHTIRKVIRNFGFFKCDRCSAKYREKINLTRHRLYETCDKHICLECDISFSNKSNLYRHRRVRHRLC